MDKLRCIRELLAQINMPQKQRSNICALTLLAMGNIRQDSSWHNATNNWLRIHDIITFAAENYNTVYAENSRETFRKQAIHPFRTAALIEDNGLATNSPNYRYRLTTEFLKVIREIPDNPSGATEPSNALMRFLAKHESLSKKYASKKKLQKMPVRINEHDYSFSPGKHNQLQKAVIEEFAPRFAPDSVCLYVGATYKKFSDKLAWETEVWIGDMPAHMIHLNGDRFLGPRNNVPQSTTSGNKQ